MNMEWNEELLAIRINTTPVLIDTVGAKQFYLNNNERYPIFNSSLIMHRDKFIFISRCSNILNHNDGTYFYADKPHDTKNIMHVYSKDWTEDKIIPIDDSIIKYKNSPAEQGIEDIRLFILKDELWGIGAGISVGAKGREIKQIIFKLKDNVIVEFLVLESPYEEVYEKNWIPFVLNNELYVIYRYTPIEVYKIKNNKMILIVGNRQETNDFVIRGSTPLININDNYVGLVHLEPIKYNNKLYYEHKFIQLNSSFQLLDLSESFYIQKKGIEFACGFVYDNNELIISYGVSDRAGSYLKISKDVLNKFIVIT
jgi:hypothetical protein